MHPPSYSTALVRTRARLGRAGVRLVGWGRTRTVSGLLALLSLGPSSCQQKANEQTPAPPAPSGASEPQRGASVVFEKVAGEFLEGTVLERNGDRLRVQTHDGHASLNLTAEDVYSLSRPHLETAPGRFAVCGTGAKRWQGCRVESSQPGRVSVLTLDGAKHTLATDRVLSLSSLSQMNVQRAFERAAKQRRFESDLTQAGAPVAPEGWTPHAGERVIALRKGEWYTAHVHEFEKDGAIRVRFRSDGEIEKLERASIIPEPPYRQAIERGDFALLRPKAESRPWIAVRVRGVETEEAEFKVQDVNDQIYDATSTALVPLGH